MNDFKTIGFAFTTIMIAAACAPPVAYDESGEEEGEARQIKAALSNEGPCEPDLDYSGRCEGDKLIWCEGGNQMVADCSETGRSCGYQNDQIGHNCMAESSAPAGGACGDVDYAGYCDGDTLVWCETGTLQSYDCSSSSKSCGYQSEEVGYNCLGNGGQGSGGRLTITQLVGGADFDISQDYGLSDFYGGYGYCQAYGDWGGQNTHCGLDVSIPYGTALYIPEDGTVIVAGETQYFEDATNPAAGELRIQTGDGSHIILGHMSEISVWNGQAVSAGDYAGLSGTQNGGHVHVEVRAPSGLYDSGFATVDPLEYFGW